MLIQWILATADNPLHIRDIYVPEKLFLVLSPQFNILCNSNWAELNSSLLKGCLSSAVLEISALYLRFSIDFRAIIARFQHVPHLGLQTHYASMRLYAFVRKGVKWPTGVRCSHTESSS